MAALHVMSVYDRQIAKDSCIKKLNGGTIKYRPAGMVERASFSKTKITTSGL